VATSTPETDISPGSSGSLISGYEAKLLTPEGLEITSLDTPGELYLHSPSITSLGYFGNEQATKETFPGGEWLRTGDEAMFRLSERGGDQHLWITDRVKELIKVNVITPIPQPSSFPFPFPSPSLPLPLPPYPHIHNPTSKPPSNNPRASK
jgi:long-subunit acyl-CoA synthetase (AMP-forming)